MRDSDSRPLDVNQNVDPNDTELNAIWRLHFFVRRRFDKIEARLSQITNKPKPQAQAASPNTGSGSESMSTLGAREKSEKATGSGASQGFVSKAISLADLIEEVKGEPECVTASGGVKIFGELPSTMEELYTRDFVIRAMLVARGGTHNPEALRRQVCERTFDRLRQEWNERGHQGDVRLVDG